MIGYLALATLVSPLTTFAVKVVTGRKLKKVIPYISVVLTAFSTLLSLLILYLVLLKGSFTYAFNWIEIGNLSINAGIFLDTLSAFMLVIVWLVSLAVQVYSLSYMSNDLRKDYYFAFLSLFVFSMTGLVIASNLLITFIFWELVGLCSYLLIGFWFDRPEASKASIKAFIVTRLGDIAFMMGIVAMYVNFQTLDIVELGHISHRLPSLIVIPALLIFIGAMGKSAQFPLHVWLPDAMEGPTPVSALIHAATMVAAGVYILARTQYLFVDAQLRAIILAVGLVTAILASLIAVFQRDIKKVLAFSTISQLGYMMVGVGAGAFSYAMFHLTTHAFFKALLFLAAGSVFHAAHSLDIFEMGALFKKMKLTGALFLIGALSLAGFPGTGGFFSKDSIIHAVKESSVPWVYYLLLFGAFLTAFYIFRVFFRAFFGERGKVFEEVHESDTLMTIPMLFLGIFALASSYFAFTELFKPAVSGHVELEGIVTGSIVSLIGIGVAWISYGPARGELELIKNKYFMELYDAFYYRLYIDDFYEVIFYGGYNLLSKLLNWVDKYIIDGFIRGIIWVLVKVGREVRILDEKGVDEVVIGIGWFLKKAGEKIEEYETDSVQLYVAISILITMLIAVSIIFGGMS